MQKLKVALVDDHVMLRTGLATLINDMNEYTVVLQSSNGKEFSESITKNNVQPDIVLLDVSMPYMDGFETAEWITTHLPLANILALSMFDDEKTIIKMIRHGAKGYILKDSEPKQLSVALHNVMYQGYHYTDLVNGKLIHAISSIDSNKTIANGNNLTTKEKEFLKLNCSEMTYKEIANIMYLSVRTVEGYRDNLFSKLNIKTRIGLVLYAIRNDIFSV